MTIKITPAPAYQKPSGRLYLGSNQLNLVNNIATIVALDTIGAGFTDAIEDTTLHRITPGYAGFYNIVGMVTFLNIVAARNYAACILVNSVVSYCYHVSWAGGGTYYGIPVGDEIKLTATDYVQLIAVSISGDNTVDLSAGLHQTFLSVQRVR